MQNKFFYIVALSALSLFAQAQSQTTSQGVKPNLPAPAQAAKAAQPQQNAFDKLPDAQKITLLEAIIRKNEADLKIAQSEIIELKDKYLAVTNPQLAREAASAGAALQTNIQAANQELQKSAAASAPAASPAPKK